MIATLEAQLGGAELREEDPRVSLRVPLARANSALHVVPVLGAVHGLSTGSMSLYRVVSFDVLHVWKLGILRSMAQNVPAFMRRLCGRTSNALMGTVVETLDVLNLLMFELGRHSKASPASPVYVIGPQEGLYVPWVSGSSRARGRSPILRAGV